MFASMLKVSSGKLAFVLLQGALATSALAHDIHAKSDATVPPAFDVTSASASTDGRLATFAMEVTGDAGSIKPEKVGKLAGAKVDAYVWPTKLDPAAVGFAKGSGILALAVTAHPDFDDTPLFDENGDGDPTNDGANWHSHWVVLASDKGCAGGLRVQDISPGQDLLPATAPGLPLALDSPGMSPIINGKTVRITVPVKGAENVNFDAVAAHLQVNETGKTPLLCVTGTYKVASGNLTLPGTITREKK
ncbi:conserved hypothetical protein [Nitrobacter hamburgensis X14]|uniref:Uncharacterized protein n=1 Tax=Nitrobacter hamburgensis (strain DSM 10229 / NCIMB 13809 / X14) TaxID=323097 RepID=Q1QQF2_NITHX|nr:hypothetical protein [Nitrobacter hamburgensis]ABE61545.1 conserved hypothetical protein [Nitrobacter hamburgensis X14]